MNQNELQNNTIKINNLAVGDNQQVEIKGNPSTQNTSLADLEPNGEVKGGPTKRIWDYIRVS